MSEKECPRSLLNSPCPYSSIPINVTPTRRKIGFTDSATSFPQLSFLSLNQTRNFFLLSHFVFILLLPHSPWSAPLGQLLSHIKVTGHNIQVTVCSAEVMGHLVNPAGFTLGSPPLASGYTDSGKPLLLYHQASSSVACPKLLSVGCVASFSCLHSPSWVSQTRTSELRDGGWSVQPSPGGPMQGSGSSLASRLPRGKDCFSYYLLLALGPKTFIQQTFASQRAWAK